MFLALKASLFLITTLFVILPLVPKYVTIDSRKNTNIEILVASIFFALLTGSLFALILFILPFIGNPIAIGWIGATAMLSVCHFGILMASANTPIALNWKETLRPSPKLMRQMFWIYGWFIVLMIISVGTITIVHTETLASGDPLARWICGMIAVF